MIWVLRGTRGIKTNQRELHFVKKASPRRFGLFATPLDLDFDIYPVALLEAYAST